MKAILRDDQSVSILAKNNRAQNIYTIDSQNGYMLAEYMQEERRGSALERTANKREQKRPNVQWGAWFDLWLALTLNSSIIVL